MKKGTGKQRLYINTRACTGAGAQTRRRMRRRFNVPARSGACAKEEEEKKE